MIVTQQVFLDDVYIGRTVKRRYSPRKTNSWVFEAMIFEPKTDFSERDISLDTLNEERRFWAKEGDSKSREFVLRGLYVSGTVLRTTKKCTSPI